MKAWKMFLVAIAAILISCSSRFPTETGPQFSAIVNYDQSLADDIAAGKYDKVLSNIENFPTEGSGQTSVNFTLVHFNCWISTTSAAASIDSQGLRQATLQELLAFGAKYPDEQRGRCIVELGTFGPCQYCPPTIAYLYGNPTMRGISAQCVDTQLDTICCFLAVRK
jgi:hypothetical protein